MATIQREIRKRGFFGIVFKWLFILFNVAMIAWVVAVLSLAGDQMGAATSEAEQAGTAVGTVLGMGMLMTFWVMGDIILGLLVLFTRGSRILITEEV